MSKRKPSKPEHPLARAMRSKIGRVCHFTADTGEVIEGFYQRGRRVVQTVGMRRMTESQDGARGFVVDEVTWVVPREVKITMGQKPAPKDAK